MRTLGPVRTLAALLVAAALATGCGEEPADGPGEGAADRASGTGAADGQQAEPGDPSTGPVAFEEVALLSESDVGGSVSDVAVPLDDQEAVAAFAEQFEGSRMHEALEEAVAGADVGPRRALLGSVVAVGCAQPEQLLVRATGAGVEVTSTAPKERMQCLVPVTTVALVTVDEDLVTAR
jgi:hypothetical protein